MYTRRQKTTRKENKLKHGNEICTAARVCGERMKRRVDVHEKTNERGGGGTETTVIPPRPKAGKRRPPERKIN